MTADQYSTDLTVRVAHVSAQIAARRYRKRPTDTDQERAKEAARAFVRLQDAQQQELQAELELCRMGVY